MTDLAEHRAACPLSAWTGAPGRCQWCDNELGARRRSFCSDRCRRAWERNHVWRHARVYARRRAKYRCGVDGCLAERHDCEVNHRTPRNGQGYEPGCHHHQDPAPDGTGGLEVLCHAHHVEVTNAQAAARRARTPAAHPAE